MYYTYGGGGAEIPATWCFVWFGGSCPDGSTRVTAWDGQFLRGASSYTEDAGGSDTHDHAYDAHTHTGVNHSHSIASHSHGLSGTTSINTSDAAFLRQSGVCMPNSNHEHSISATLAATSATSGDATPSLSSGGSGTTSAESHRPPTSDVLICEAE